MKGGGDGVADMNTESKSNRDIWLIVLFSVIGGLISALSFFLFYKVEHVLMVIGICSLDVVYGYFNLRLFIKSREWNGVRHVFSLLIMVTYWAIVFGVICIGNAILLDGVFSPHFFLYPIFLIPAFELVILLLCLVAQGL